MSTPIHHKLEQAFSPTHLDIVDNSWMHAGHQGNTGGYHLVITIVSPAFEGISLMDRHRLVHQHLKDEMATQIHALELKLFAPNEWLAVK